MTVGTRQGGNIPLAGNSHPFQVMCSVVGWSTVHPARLHDAVVHEARGVSIGRTRRCLPRSSSSNAPNTLGESNRGQRNQSTEPSVLTNAAVRRSPTGPWSAIGSGPVVRHTVAGHRAGDDA